MTRPKAKKAHAIRITPTLVGSASVAAWQFTASCPVCQWTAPNARDTHAAARFDYDQHRDTT